VKKGGAGEGGAGNWEGRGVGIGREGKGGEGHEGRRKEGRGGEGRGGEGREGRLPCFDPLALFRQLAYCVHT
jgi:hypothetical protein